MENFEKQDVQKVQDTQETTPQPQKETNKTKKTVINIILAILIVIMLASAIGFTVTMVKKKQHENEMQNLVELVETQGETDTQETYPSEPAEVLPQYRSAYQINSDLVGWIRVPNTHINHPVAQSEDNDFYLYKDFKTKEGSLAQRSRGTIFMDYRNNIQPLDKNTILHGHNNLDTTMFSDLEKYKDLDFYKENPVVYFDTIYEEHVWKVFAVFYANASPELDNGYVFNYVYPAMTDSNFAEYIQEVEKRTLIKTDVEVLPTDKILTLSTCTRDLDLKRGKQENVRIAILARLVRPGESEEVDTSKAKRNENPKHPQLWYDKHKQENPYKNDPRWYPKGATK